LSSELEDLRARSEASGPAAEEELAEAREAMVSAVTALEVAESAAAEAAAAAAAELSRAINDAAVLTEALESARAEVRRCSLTVSKPVSKLPGTKRLKLEYGESLSMFAFDFDLRLYTEADAAAAYVTHGKSTPQSTPQKEEASRVTGALRHAAAAAAAEADDLRAEVSSLRALLASGNPGSPNSTAAVASAVVGRCIMTR
jgi:hypothetical protein